MRFLDVVSMTQMEISVENMWAEDVRGLVQNLRCFTVSSGMPGSSRAELYNDWQMEILEIDKN